MVGEAKSRLNAALRDRGYRVTLQRSIIMETLEGLAGHVSVEDIYARVRERFPQVNISTVYRTLELMEEAGLAVHTHFDDGVAKWHRAEEGAHQHLVCRRCGQELELDLDVVEPLAEQLRARYGFQPDIAHFAIVGVCRSCSERAQ
ncbi:MAG: transcriptional repressor [Chloroflexi bacterium]|nr:transcriptional repressor [Chloroflexota bacterium]